MSDLATIALLVLLLLTSAMFSAAEISLLSLGTRRVKRVTRGPIGRLVGLLVSRPAITLGAILIAITSINYSAEALAAGWVITRGLPVVYAAVGMALLILVFTEMTPIFYAAANPERVAPVVALPVWLATWVLFLPSRLFSLIATGLAFLLGGRAPAQSPVTEGELRAIVDLQTEAGGLDAEEKVMIHSIFEFGDTVAREVMIPRTDMVAIPETATVWEAARATTDRRLSRLPVYRRDLDDVVGVVHVKDLLSLLADGDRDRPVSAVMTPPFRVPETRKLDDLLTDFRRQRRTLAIVVDEYGGTAGLVTLEDLLEEVVGDIWDEFDVIRPLVDRRADGAVELDGRISVDEASEALGVALPEGEYDSLGGLVYSHLGEMPRAGDTLELEGVTLTVAELEGVRITRVVAELRPPQNSNGETGVRAPS